MIYKFLKSQDILNKVMYHLILVLKFIPRRSAFIIFAKMFTSEIRPSSKSKFNILEYETKNAIRADKKTMKFQQNTITIYLQNWISMFYILM